MIIYTFPRLVIPGTHIASVPKHREARRVCSLYLCPIWINNEKCKTGGNNREGIHVYFRLHRSNTEAVKLVTDSILCHQLAATFATEKLIK